MFTGIVQAVGQIDLVEPLGAPHTGRRLRIAARELGLDEVRIGDSIAINGACMTVVGKTDATFTVDVSAESLSKTHGLDTTGPVNLEKAMRLGDRIDGHLVSGHVDGLGIVQSLTEIGESWELVVRAPAALSRYLAYKGSVAIDGVSLTVNRVEDRFDDQQRLLATDVWINLIPHTVAVTTLRALRAGQAVNLEVDPIARYCERMLALQGR